MTGFVEFAYAPGASDEDIVSLNGPISPTRVEPFAQFVTDRTTAGTRFAYQMHDAVVNEWELRFPSITVAQKTAFDLWFRDTVRGPNEPFRYTHTDGTAYSNCRMVSPSLAWERLNSNEWSLTLRIEVPAEVAA